MVDINHVLERIIQAEEKAKAAAEKVEQARQRLELELERELAEFREKVMERAQLDARKHVAETQRAVKKQLARLEESERAKQQAWRRKAEMKLGEAVDLLLRWVWYGQEDGKAEG